MAESVYLVSGARTPIGSFMGSLAACTAPELGAVAIQAAMERGTLSPELIEEVHMGCVLAAGLGQAPARQAMLKAGLPISTGAVTLNKVCGSGMQAVIQARSHILAGEADIMLAGGMESMSNAPYLLREARKGFRMGNQTAIDSMIHDGLWDPYDNKHMGLCAEACAEKYQFSQVEQDDFAAMSYTRALNSIETKLFAPEIADVSIPGKGGQVTIVDTDEEPGRGNIEKLPSLRPAFDKAGSITAGNASTLNDGASALILASKSAVSAHGLKPIARIVAVARHAQEPLWFTTAPIGAIQKALTKANLTVNDIDAFEINEAFALVAMAAIKDLSLDINKVNIRGGAVALGHPIGSTGSRLLVTLSHILTQTNTRYGLATLCIGGGEATAIIIENCQL